MIYFKQFLCVFILLSKKSKIFVGKNAKHLKKVKKSNFCRKLFRAEKLPLTETTHNQLKDVNCVV